MSSQKKKSESGTKRGIAKLLKKKKDSLKKGSVEKKDDDEHGIRTCEENDATPSSSKVCLSLFYIHR